MRLSRYGIEPGGYAIALENEDGSIDTQAGSHPYQLQSTVNFNQTLEEVQLPGQPRRLEAGAPGLTKDIGFSLPPGLLGNLTAAGQCSAAEFSSLATSVGGVRNFCPAGSAIGVATVTILAPSPLGYATVAVPLFNLEPAQGEPARFGFEVEAVPVVVDVAVRTDGDYGVTASVNNATAAAQVLGAQVIFWGQPGDQSHDGSRGWSCLREGLFSKGETCQAPNPRPGVPFLTLPTSCTGQLLTTMAGTDWTGEPVQGSYLFSDQLGNPLASLEGCDQLPFDPSHRDPAAAGRRPADDERRAPRRAWRSTSTLRQEGTLDRRRARRRRRPQRDRDPAGRASWSTPPPPTGYRPAPSSRSATKAQVRATRSRRERAAPLRFSSAKAACPDASKVGMVRIKTPLLGEELTGSVYLAAQDANPFGSLIALYIVAENEKLGLRVKLAGEGKLDEQTGQVSTTFADTPQVPFEELHVQAVRRAAWHTLDPGTVRLLHDLQLLQLVVGRDPHAPVAAV